jgi:hypothetical protein
MSETLAVARRNVRLMTDDMDPNDYATDSERLNLLIDNRMQLMAQEVGLGPVWVAGAVTLVSGTFAYLLPATMEYNRVVAVQLNSLEWLLERVTTLELKAMQDGPGTITGDPTQYALYEDDTQVVNIWMFPTPNEADTLNILRSRVPANLTTDATLIPFSAPLLRCLEKSVAVESVLLMDPEERQKRKATLDQAPKWEKEVARAIKLEKVRFGNLKRSDRVPERWV